MSKLETGASKRVFLRLGSPTHIICLMLTLGLLSSCTMQAPRATTDRGKPMLTYTADWESLKKHNAAPEWFRDAKFGIYFHWGVYSVPAFGSEWYPRNMHLKNRREYKHHMEKYGDPAEFGYHDFVPMFKAEKFNADEWADLFKKSGARFAGPVAEHHDGFSMWASELTPWNVKDMGPKRDITGELAKAIRKRGMRFVTTFHHARNNQHQIKRNDKLVGAEPAAARYIWTGHYPRVEGWPTTSEDPKLRILYGNIPRQYFLDMWKGKLIEVIDKYQPDLMWFDSWLNEIPDEYKMSYLAYYFNKANEWGKEVVVTFKQDDLPQDVGVLDLEKGRMGELTTFSWLTDDTISKGSWCYTQDLAIKPTSIVLHSLIDIVSKNGVLLLNISPKADGTIPDNQKKVLLEMGDWLRRHSEAIYATRPWVTYGEGPTKLRSGRFGGFTDVVGYTAQDIRYTCKGKTIYAIVLGWPGEPRPSTDGLGENEQVVMTMFGKGNKAEGIKVKDVSMLGTKREIKWERREAGLVVGFPATKNGGWGPVNTPAAKINDLAVVFKISTLGWPSTLPEGRGWNSPANTK